MGAASLVRRLAACEGSSKVGWKALITVSAFLMLLVPVFELGTETNP